jgi:hypothetical protein
MQKKYDAQKSEMFEPDLESPKNPETSGKSLDSPVFLNTSENNIHQEFSI